MAEPPNDQVAEESILGCMLMSDLAIDIVSQSVVASDFYRPANGTIFDAIVRLRASGTPVDSTTVGNALKEAGTFGFIGDPSIFARLIANTPSLTNTRHYAKIVTSHALRRRLATEGAELVRRASDLTIDAEEVLETHQELVVNLGATVLDAEPDDISVEDFMERPRETISPWVVHGLIRRQHKVMVIAAEGHGKSVLLRFIAICAAYGVEPFRHHQVPPVRTLIVDLENPEDALFDTFKMILDKVRGVSPEHETVNRLWWRPAGINLRNRADVAAFENVIRIRRPDLVCLGPMYASYENKPGESWEAPALEVQRVLKRLMVRYNFALLLEDHMPQADSSGKRPMRPYGSSMWRRWLDIGIGLDPIAEDVVDSFNVKHWRGSRTHTDWPTHIERGSVTGSNWPFLGRWE